MRCTSWRSEGSLECSVLVESGSVIFSQIDFMSDIVISTPSPFSLLTNPEAAIAAARRLEKAPLKRVSERLDGRAGKAVDAATAKFDEAIEMGKVVW